MAKYLVVVESPAKARTINKFLGNNYIVKASNGHVRDLPKRVLGVDIEHDFNPTYEPLKEAGKAIKELRSAADKVEHILLATDPDREGEAIGWHVAEILNTKKPIDRIVFNAITKRSILDAATKPRPLDQNLVDAQQARRILDRLVGYKLSPFLQWLVRKRLSAGRVQSVAVRMVCDREAEIRAFVIEEYWTLDAIFQTPRNETLTGRLTKYHGEKIAIPNEDDARRIMSELDGAKYVVTSVERKEVERRPYAPFITSTLQQEASRKLRFSPRKTMQLAQQLYEGVSPDAGGLITYMRTDSTRIAPEAIEDVRSFIRSNFEPRLLPAKPNFFASKKGAQDAHEAIRPTSVSTTPDAASSMLDKDQLALYTLIWKRFVASQMAPAVFDQMGIDIEAKSYTFRATGSLMKFPGFTKLYEETSDDTDNGKEGESALPDVREGENVTWSEFKPEQHFTKPPARYTEASLIRALEENGIGRPSTYAPTINTIQERGYVAREKGRLLPTELGEEANTLLLKHFPDILDLKFTARMEDDLDHVEDGAREWHDVLKVFYNQFAHDLETAQKNLLAETGDGNTTCPNCGSPMEVREGRFGMFVACQKYPECKTTQRVEKKTAEPTNEVCDKCGAPMVIRTGRFGRFMACSNYPKCKNTHNVDKDGNKIAREPKEPPKKTDQKCPNCGAFLLIRKSRKGEEFYGCEKYPKCKFTKPMELNLKCPNCGGNLVSKLAKRRRFIGCDQYPKCDFTVAGEVDKNTPCPECEYPWTMLSKPKNKPQMRKCPSPTCNYQQELDED